MLRDEMAPDHVAVAESRVEYEGPIFTIRNDQVRFSSGDVARRQYMEHADAVAIVALREGSTSASGEPEVLLIRQYRHAPRRIFWEIPAGLRDHAGEDPLEAAKRELAEEADVSAQNWQKLVSFYSSPGCSDENLDVYLARGIAPVESGEAGADFERVEEEREIEVQWHPLESVIEAVMRGDLRSPTLVLGVLAAQRVLDQLSKE